MTLNSIMILGLVGGALACMITAIYAIPSIRTWRKERGMPVGRNPGPELEPHEQSALDELERAEERKALNLKSGPISSRG